MKMKKSLIVISMFAVMLALSGCEDNQEAAFEYDDSEIVLDTMYYFDQYADVSEDYAKYYIENGTEFEQSAVKGIRQAIDTDKVGKLQDYSGIISNARTTGMFSPESVDYEINNAEDSVSVTIINRAENRDVEITVKYVENPDYFMMYDRVVQYYTDETIQSVIAQNEGLTLDYMLMMYGCSNIEELKQTLIESEMEESGLMPYKAEEMVVSAVYSRKELMASAGRNTIIGMGTVFVVLIFISFIISLFKFLPALFAPKPKLSQMKEEIRPPVPAAVPKPVTASNENLMNDAELVAVITAAIYAASSGADGAVSKDKLVVRSIRRAKR